MAAPQRVTARAYALAVPCWLVELKLAAPDAQEASAPLGALLTANAWHPNVLQVID